MGRTRPRRWRTARRAADRGEEEGKGAAAGEEGIGEREGRGIAEEGKGRERRGGGASK